MKEEPNNPGIDPKLEARIVALVLGEASDFERDELSRLIEQRQELATLKEQIQRVHGLLLDVGTGESIAEDDDWKLSGENRSAVLAVISAEEQEQPAKQVVNKSAEKRRLVKGNFFWNLSKIAAVVCVVGFLGTMAVSPLFNSRSTDSARRPQLALGFHGGMYDAISIAGDEEHSPTAGVELDYEKSSKSALSAIRNSLDVDATASPEGANDGKPQQTVDFRGRERHYLVGCAVVDSAGSVAHVDHSAGEDDLRPVSFVFVGDVGLGFEDRVLAPADDFRRVFEV